MTHLDPVVAVRMCSLNLKVVALSLMVISSLGDKLLVIHTPYSGSHPWHVLPVTREMLGRGHAVTTIIYKAWLPDGYSQIFKSYVFGPSGLKVYGSASLRCKICSLPFLGLRPGGGRGGAIQGKEGIKFCSVA